MTTTTTTDPKTNLEIGGAEPNFSLIASELEQARGDLRRYLDRNANAMNIWNARWDGQQTDGLKHGAEGGPNPFPFDGASDSRIRTVDGQIRDHVLVAEFAFDQAKVQARALRPFAQDQGRDAARATQLLSWMLYTHLAAELQREIPLALYWRFGYGASALAVEWEQARRLDFHEISLAQIDQVMQAMGAAGGNSMLQELVLAIRDPAQEENVAQLLQALSPVLTRGKARGLVRDLREKGTAQIPVASIYLSKPRVTALRLGVDLLFPADATDLRISPRWTSRREWVSESELRDRIETEGYDTGFVEKAVAKKGQGADATGLQQTLEERQALTGWGYETQPGGNFAAGFRNLIELQHFIYRAIEYGTPCLYRTVFCPAVSSKSTPLYATHGVYEYAHGEHPYTEMMFERRARSLLESRGIPEIAYTWENEIKTQADGLADRTSLVNSPIMIVPHNRVAAMAGQQRLPGSVLGVTRKGEVDWQPLPPSDGTPVEVIQMVEVRVARFFGLFGPELDPELKQMRRQRLGAEVCGELNLAFDQVFKLMQQFLPDDDIAGVVGALQRPFKVSREQIRGGYEISVAVDMRMMNEDYVSKKLDLIGKALQFNQAGTANMSGLFKLAMENIDPDAADDIVQDDQTATDKEKQDELGAVGQAMNGIEAPLPQQGNHQLRMQTLLGATLQSTNPLMKNRLAQNPDTVAILQNRLKFFQNQIQQMQQNPQIGRMLSTQTFNKQAPQAALPAGGQA